MQKVCQKFTVWKHISIGVRVSARRGDFRRARKAKDAKSVACGMDLFLNPLMTAYGK